MHLIPGKGKFKTLEFSHPSRNVFDLIPGRVDEEPEQRILDEKHGMIVTVAGKRVNINGLDTHILNRWKWL